MASIRYSFSRFQVYGLCPRKHFYKYVEELKTIDSSSNIHTFIGDMWHRIVENYHKKNYAEVKKVLKEYEDAYSAGKTLLLEESIMDSTYHHYINHYKNLFDDIDIIAAEVDLSELLDASGDTFSGKVDLVYRIRSSGLVILRDTKTTLKALKYQKNDVLYNQQLLLYVPYIENKFKITIDAIEIDEVRLALLQPTPINANGKPTSDKRRLGLTTYDDYYNTLKSMKLHMEKEYAAALEYTYTRGHPLFNLVRVPIYDRHVIDQNIQDIQNIYYILKEKQEDTFRVRGPLCNFCDYRDLCNFDMINGDTTARNSLIKTKFIVKPTDKEENNEEEIVSFDEE
jgi:CRISPR/Cas system-associated exonuclease Cas4 (RecB family)